MMLQDLTNYIVKVNFNYLTFLLSFSLSLPLSVLLPLSSYFSVSLSVCLSPSLCMSVSLSLCLSLSVSLSPYNDLTNYIVKISLLQGLLNCIVKIEIISLIISFFLFSLFFSISLTSALALSWHRGSTARRGCRIGSLRKHLKNLNS